jgi:hypothetical protein
LILDFIQACVEIKSSQAAIRQDVNVGDFARDAQSLTAFGE